MYRQMIVIFLLASCAVLTAIYSHPTAEREAPTVASNPATRAPSEELVRRISAFSSNELEKFGFRELHLMKHALLAISGQDFTDDRPWLKDYLYSIAPLPSADLAECESGDRMDQCQILPVCEEGCKLVNFQNYELTEPKENASVKPSADIQKCLARIRQALFSKLRDLSAPSELAAALDREKGSFQPLLLKREINGAAAAPLSSLSILGKVMLDSAKMDEFLLRDLTGDLTALNFIEQINKDNYEFDVSELLGLGLGDVDLLRKGILAHAGKTFEEPLKTELAELGVKARGSSSQVTLSPTAQKAMERLDLVVHRMASSELDDLPHRMKGEDLESDNISLSYSGTM